MVNRALPIPEADWQRHRTTIAELYALFPLDTVIKHMQNVYGFSATSKQYKRRLSMWCIEKNLRADDMERLLHSSDGDKTVRGITISDSKLRRYRRRQEKRALSTRVSTAAGTGFADGSHLDLARSVLIDPVSCTSFDEPSSAINAGFSFIRALPPNTSEVVDHQQLCLARPQLKPRRLANSGDVVGQALLVMLVRAVARSTTSLTMHRYVNFCYFQIYQ